MSASRPPVLQCPCCDSSQVRIFHRTADVPVNSVLLLPNRAEAEAFPTGDIDLGFCRACGFIYNTAFDPSRLEYSERYDPTQAFSATFNQWHRALAEQLIERYGLRDKHLIEIGCGKGEFLAMLCEMGGNSGVGFDPAYTPSDRSVGAASGRIRFITDLYSEKYADHKGDFVCCKMTLEHIQPASEFVGTVRRSVGEQYDATIFFQVPDVLRILKETAFWDIYYEHCSYYSLGSLARLFRRCDFTVIDLAREYDDQYIMVEARPGRGEAGPPLAQEDDLRQLETLVGRFAENFAALQQQWRERLQQYRRDSRRAVVWGSGSKGVAFLTTLGATDDIEYVVDINPNRQGYYMAKTGQQIVAPAFLQEYRPDVVIVMNPVYRDEIVAELDGLGLRPEVITT